MRLSSSLNNLPNFKPTVAYAERLTFFSVLRRRGRISYRVVATIGRVPVAVKYAPVRNTGGSLTVRKFSQMMGMNCTSGHSHAEGRICPLKLPKASI